MPKVVSGQRLRIYASDYNAMLDAAQALRNQQHNISIPFYGSGGAGIIPMRNDSGEDLQIFAVLDITGVIFEPGDNEQEFLYRFTATGGKPADGDNPALAIAQEPIATGKIGRVMVYGVSPVKLIRKDDDESPTAGASDSTAHLESAKLGAQVLWEEEYTGDEEHWALVRFPIVIGKKKSLDVVTDVTCNEETGQMDLETETVEYLSLDWKEEEEEGGGGGEPLSSYPSTVASVTIASMPYPIEKKLVIAIASSALFDLAESDAVYRRQGRDAYRRYQRRNERKVLRPGVAFPFIKRLLSLRAMNPKDPPVEVVLLSRNDPDTGLRVFNSIEKHGLDISRAAFTSGEQPYLYMASFNACLFLSANEQDVRDAIAHGQPAGLVLPSKFADDPKDRELRIAFDFDGVVGSDEAEKVFKRRGLPGFMRSEKKKAAVALSGGPLQRLLAEIAGLQRHEADRHAKDRGYQPRVRTAIMTARCAPAHKRVVNTLRRWGITVDEVFFLGGVQKKRVLEIFRPHLFFDDQQYHLKPVAESLPCVHVPFGVVNA